MRRSGKRVALLAAVVAAGLAAGCQRAGREQQNLPTIEAALTYAPEVPPPITRSSHARVVVRLVTKEQTGGLASGVTYNFWTYNGHVPGPFIRVRVGDTLEVHLKNESPDKTHTVDFHAVSGPGGGAPVLMADPGKESVGSFKILRPGLFIYHCAANPMPAHIANGLYGLLLAETENGMTRADREYYVMQSEFYTAGDVGAPGFQAYSSQKAAAERPDYVVFNGRVGALKGAGMLKANVGEDVRIYFGNIGPNKVSAFHIVGVVMGKLYRDGSLMQPERDIQTALVPPGGAAVVEFHPRVPGAYTLLDHSIFRTDRGAMGILNVQGPDAPDIYRKIR